MYLISSYFEEETTKRIQTYMDLIAEKTGNRFMIDGKVPPHITISAFEVREEEKVKAILREKFSSLPKGTLTWCSVGMFFPYVIYLAPVLNAYVHRLSEEVYECLSGIDGVEIHNYYKPFQWMPHTTIGKTLSKEEMKTAFAVMQEQFAVFEGTVTKIGLAKTNPHRDLLCVECRETSSTELS